MGIDLSRPRRIERRRGRALLGAGGNSTQLSRSVSRWRRGLEEIFFAQRGRRDRYGHAGRLALLHAEATSWAASAHRVGRGQAGTPPVAGGAKPKVRWRIGAGFGRCPPRLRAWRYPARDGLVVP